MMTKTGICLDEKILEKARELRKETGVPISQQFVLAWKKMWSVEYDSK